MWLEAVFFKILRLNNLKPPWMSLASVTPTVALKNVTLPVASHHSKNTILQRFVSNLLIVLIAEGQN